MKYEHTPNMFRVASVTVVIISALVLMANPLFAMEDFFNIPRMHEKLKTNFGISAILYAVSLAVLDAGLIAFYVSFFTHKFKK